MRSVLVMVVAGWCGAESAARAVELRSELSIGREFVYLTNGAETEVFDGQVGLGAGLTMISDYTIERYGAAALVEYRGERVSAGVAATFGPRQERRGWASLDPHAELQLGSATRKTRVAAGVLLRRIDVAAHVGSITIDQLQLHAEIETTFAERWRLGALALYSFYDPNPAAARLRDVDVGLAVTLAGRPERWAVGGHVARRLARPLWLELGLAGVGYANGRGEALVPHVGGRVGAWRGVSIGASIDVVVDLESGADERVRTIGGLELEYER